MPPDAVKIEMDPEEKDDSQEKVDVTPEEKAKGSAEDQLAVKIKADFEALYGGRLKQTEDRLAGAQRINARLEKELEAVKTQVAKPVPVADPKDPWAGIENGQTWKAEIEKVAEQKAEAKLKSWQAEQAAQSETQLRHAALESSKQTVVTKYPDLHPETGNPDTVVSKTYVAALNEHPDWLSNPYGPQLAMYAMEEKLKAEATNGAAVTGSSAKARNSSLSPSRPSVPGGERITLTREQKAFCDRHQLKYEDYLKTATAVDQGAVEA